LNQSFNNYELILVDDGSPDRCPEICYEYARSNDKIKVIHKENGGLPDARNAGLRIASGKYVLFLDSDDYLNTESLKKLNDCIESVGEVDVLFCSMMVYHENESLFYKHHKGYPEQFRKNVSGTKMLVELINATQTLLWSASGSLFNREKLINNSIFFDKTFTGAEDLDFFMRVVMNSNKFAAENIDICVYRIGRKGSITTDLNKKAYYVQLFVMKKWFDYFYSLNIDDSDKHILCSFFSSRYIQKIFELTRFEKTEKKELIQFIKSNNYLLDYPTYTKCRILGKTYKFFGPDFGTKIQKLYHKLISNRFGPEVAIKIQNAYDKFFSNKKA